MPGNTSLTDRIIVVIVVVWVSAIAYSMVDHGYHVPDSLHLLMSALITFLVGKRNIPRDR